MSRFSRGSRLRVAVIATHPIQYYAPWFRHLAAREELDVRVFYLWDFGSEGRRDAGFRTNVQWDIPLLDGYAYEFVPNSARDPGTHHFRGLINPGLRNRVAEWEPDAVLVYGYKFASLLRFIFQWNRKRAPLLFRGDSHRLAGGKGRLREAMIRFVYSRFGAFLAVGKANAAYFALHGVAEERVFFAPHAVDNERFAAVGREEGSAFRRMYGIAEDERVVLFAGKLEPKKRPFDLLEAFSGARMPGATLLIAGTGELEQALREAAAGMPNVKFAGFQNQSRMPAVYGAADVIVLPSVGPYETWGLCINEAMACGVPAIVSSHVGCGPDLVLPGKTGWMFDAGDKAGLRRCLVEAISAPLLLKACGAEARQLVQTQYSYDRATEGLLSAMHAVCR